MASFFPTSSQLFALITEHRKQQDREREHAGTEHEDGWMFAQAAHHGLWPAECWLVDPQKYGKIQVRWCRVWVSPGPQRPEFESFTGRVVTQGGKPMTAPEHYRPAERLHVHALELLAAGVYDAEESLERSAAVLADAEVHATLAVASVLGLSANLGAADMQACGR